MSCLARLLLWTIEFIAFAVAQGKDKSLPACLTGSELLASHANCHKVQDPYSLRCIPQVLGAFWEGFDYVAAAITLELDAVTDNPLCFPDDGVVLAGGNFHGQPLSLPLDL